MIASSAKPAPEPIDGCIRGAPSRAGVIASAGKIHQSRSEATHAPAELHQHIDAGEYGRDAAGDEERRA